METEQHIVERTMGHQRNKGGNPKVSGIYENKNTAYQNLWDTAKAVLRIIFVTEYLHKKKKTEISNSLIIQLRLQE
jgi:hypothetical protein